MSINVVRFLRLRLAMRWARRAQRDHLPARLDLAAARIRSGLACQPDPDRRVALLTGLAAVVSEAAERSGETTCLIEAASLLGEAATSVPPGHPDLPALLCNWALALQRSHEATGDLPTLAAAVDVARQAADAVGTHPARGAILATVCAIMVEAEEHLSQPELLTEAVVVGQQAVELATPDERAMALANVSCAWRLRYELGGDADDLDRAHRFAADAVAASAADDAALGDRLAELGHVLRLRHDLSGDVHDARCAVEALQASVAAVGGQEVARLAALAAALLDTHVDGDSGTVDEAVAVARQVLAAADADDFVSHQVSATVLTTAAEQSGDLRLLAEARAASLVAVQASSAAPADRAVALDTLAGALHTEFQLTGDLDRLDESIRIGTEAVEVENSSVSDRAGHLGNLAAALHDRYLHRGATDDLDRSIALHDKAADLLPDDHPDAAMHANNRGIALRERYELTGAVTDLDVSIRAGREAVARSRPHDRHVPFRLSNLGSSLHVRFARYGRIADLDDGIDLHREAARLLAVGHPWMPALLSNLAGALRSRHQHLGSRADLDEAILVLEQAVAASGPAELAAVLVEHGLALHGRYLLTGHTDDLRGSIQALRRSVDISQESDPALPGRLGNLVSILLTAPTHDRASAEEAVRTARQSLAGLPPEHPVHAGLLTNLALALQARFETSGAADDLDEAVGAAARVLLLVGPDDPDRVSYLGNLAFLHHHRFTSSGNAGDLAAAITTLRSAADDDAGPPVERLRAATALGHLTATSDPAVAADAFATAVRLLPVVSSDRLDRPDSQRWLADSAGLARAAAALAIECDRPHQAVALLELGRGVLLNRALRLHDDLSTVRAGAPSLAAEFELLRARLASPVVDTEPEPARPELPGAPRGAARGRPSVGEAHRAALRGRRREQRRRLVARLDEVMDDIRAVPGCADFLLPPTVESLLPTAAAGPIAVVNVSRYRCDALVLTEDGVQVIALPELTEELLDQEVVDFHAAVAVLHDDTTTADDARRAQRRLTQTLAWLWDAVARPVLDMYQPTGLPRMWWVPTGSLALLPLHSAGTRDQCLLDLTVPSYTPTITTLRHARQFPEQSAPGGPVVLVDGAAGLPAAVAEAHWVASAIGARALDVARASRAEVLHAIGTAGHLHVALHGHSDAADPADSGLVLNGAVLRVVEIAAVRSADADRT
ncbi:MAG TPA: CHAT domain-containing protein, partial [Pseudonocardiaceae bacterium]